MVPPCNLEVSSGLELVWWTRAETLPGTENSVEPGGGGASLEGSRSLHCSLRFLLHVRPKGDLALSIERPGVGTLSGGRDHVPLECSGTKAIQRARGLQDVPPLGSIHRHLLATLLPHQPEQGLQDLRARERLRRSLSRGPRGQGPPA